MDTAEILLSINKKLDKISEVKPVWVSAATIKKITGMDKSGLQMFRSNNRHLLKKCGKSVLYNISAIPAVMIKQNV